MEWFQAALERYKEETMTAEERPPAGPGRRSTGRLSPPPPIVYTRTKSVDIPESVLRERRVLAGIDSGPFVDAFKILRTQVVHRMRDKGWNVLGITSPRVGEGKTLTAVNLAITMAMDVTQTVLLVDADLQTPAVASMFGLSGCPGLSDYLLDDRPLEDLLIHPGMGRVVVLPGGRAIRHSAEALTSPRMLALVEEMRHRYPARLIVFDLPPLLHTSDVLSFGPYIDALLLVVEEGRTTTDDLERALLLVKGSTPVVGTVLNKAGQRTATPRVMKRLLSR